MTYKIERDVPIVGGATERKRKYPFDQMGVGDSFLINGADPKRVANAAYCYGKKHDQKRFVTRKTADGFRCWRVE